MGGKLMRGIGLERVKAHIGLKNWVYNLSRYQGKRILFLKGRLDKGFRDHD
jgi:hypothetical protein